MQEGKGGWRWVPHELAVYAKDYLYKWFQWRTVWQLFQDCFTSLLINNKIKIHMLTTSLASLSSDLVNETIYRLLHSLPCEALVGYTTLVCNALSHHAKTSRRNVGSTSAGQKRVQFFLSPLGRWCRRLGRSS